MKTFYEFGTQFESTAEHCSLDAVLKMFVVFASFKTIVSTISFEHKNQCNLNKEAHHQQFNLLFYC